MGPAFSVRCQRFQIQNLSLAHMERETSFWEVNWRESSDITQTLEGAPVYSVREKQACVPFVYWEDERYVSKRAKRSGETFGKIHYCGSYLKIYHNSIMFSYICRFQKWTIIGKKQWNTLIIKTNLHNTTCITWIFF